MEGLQAIEHFLRVTGLINTTIQNVAKSKMYLPVQTLLSMNERIISKVIGGSHLSEQAGFSFKASTGLTIASRPALNLERIHMCASRLPNPKCPTSQSKKACIQNQQSHCNLF
jgi:hypothetical protein